MENKFLIKGNSAGLINYVFQTLLVTYLVLLLLEQIWSGFVSVYLNLNYLLIAVIIMGILDVFSDHSKKDSKQNYDGKVKLLDYVFIGILGILGFAIILFKTKSSLDLWLSFLISSIAGILIILLSLLILSEDKESEQKDTPLKKYPASKKLIFSISISILISLFIISIIIPLFSPLSLIASLRIVFGSVFVLFIPGFVLTFVFFPYNLEKDSIDWLERVALSFALSIAVVPLAVFYFNLVGVKINVLNSSLIILGIIFIGIILIYIRKLKSSKGNRLSRY